MRQITFGKQKKANFLFFLKSVVAGRVQSSKWRLAKSNYCFCTLLLRSRRKRRIKYLKQFWVRSIFQTRAQLSEIFTLVKTVKELQEEAGPRRLLQLFQDVTKPICRIIYTIW
jgi:hypothetical protein